MSWWLTPWWSRRGDEGMAEGNVRDQDRVSWRWRVRATPWGPGGSGWVRNWHEGSSPEPQIHCTVIPPRLEKWGWQEDVKATCARIGSGQKPLLGARSPSLGLTMRVNNAGWKNLILHFPRLTGKQIFFLYNNLSLTRHQSYTEIVE